MKRQLEQKKMLILIAAKPLQRMVIETLAPRGIGGYTISTVTGAGTSGLNTGTLPSDSNVMIHIILSERRLVGVLEDIDALMERGYRIKAIVQDIQILPRKVAEAPASA